MSKLLRANFARLIKNKVYWICLIGLILFACVAFTGNNEGYNGVSAFFGVMVLFPMLFAAFCPLFTGTEYGDGTIRNKLVIGHTRVAVYLSNLLICIFADLVMVAVYGVAVRLACLAAGATFEIPLQNFLELLAVEVMLIVAITALLMLFIMLNQNKAVVVAASLILVFAGIMAGSYIANRLSMDEYREEVVYNVEEDVYEMQGQMVKNEQYLQPEERKYWELALDVLPFGQGLQIGTGKVANPGFLMLYSSVWTVLSTGIGIFFFRRKDIK